MRKELYQIKSKELALNITNGIIDSVRKKNLTKSGCRVYENGFIGVAGILGEPTEETWAAAESALALEIPYPHEPTKSMVKSRTLGSFVEERIFISQVEKLLQLLAEEFPEFIFSNKICATEETVILKNDAGLDLQDTQCRITIGLIFKEVTSPNIFDSVVEWVGYEFDEKAILERVRTTLRAHLTPLPMPQDPIPVLIAPTTITGILGDYLHPQKLKRGTSLLSGKEGSRVFAETLTLSADRGEDTYTAFFDAEGTIVTGEPMPLIEKGVLLKGIADKTNAQEFGMELTASAEAGYDDVPTLQINPFALQLESTGTLDEILGVRDAIYLCIASGGDITPAGDFATPVQTAYLYHGGKLTGKLPEFSIRGNIFDLLGKNYLGTSSDRLFDSQKSVALYCEIDSCSRT